MKYTLLLFILLFLSLPCMVLAQNTQDSSLLDEVSTPAITPATQTQEQKINRIADSLAAGDLDYNAYDEYVKRKVIKSPEFMLSMMILIFAIILCSAEIIVFLKGHMDADQIIKLIILTLIIFAVLFLIVLGYTNDQIGPALGLLGTIAGYLLGKSQKDKEHTKDPAPKPKPEESKA